MYTMDEQVKVIFSSQDLFKYNLHKNKLELVKRLNVELAKFNTQKEASIFIGTYQPVISAFKNYDIENISMELILEYLSKFEINIEIKSIEGKLFFRAE